jgi:hypothetical protein
MGDHGSGLALWTHGQVNAREFEDGAPPVLLRGGVRGFLGVMDVVVEHLVSKGELGPEVGRGKKAVVPDFDEALGKNVQEEASYELFVLERRALSTLGGEPHPGVVDGLEAIVRDADPVGDEVIAMAATEVLVNAFGALVVA